MYPAPHPARKDKSSPPLIKNEPITPGLTNHPVAWQSMSMPSHFSPAPSFLPPQLGNFLPPAGLTMPNGLPSLPYTSMSLPAIHTMDPPTPVQPLTRRTSTAPRDVALFLSNGRSDERRVHSGLDLLNEASKIHAQHDALTRESSPVQTRPGTRSGEASEGFGEAEVPMTDSEALSLPPREKTDELLDWFRTYVHAITPIFPYDRFFAKINHLYEVDPAERSKQPIFLAMFNLALALACQTLLSANDRQQDHRLGRTLFRRSQHLAPLQDVVSNGASLETIQYLVR